jgi:hypothetical protein
MTGVKKLRGGKRYYKRLRERASTFGLDLDSGRTYDVPAQVFVSLAPACHSEQDALYVHTPNPNGTPFPHSFNGVRWDIATPAFLRRFVDGEAWKIGALSGKDEGWWVVRPRLGGEV